MTKETTLNAEELCDEGKPTPGPYKATKHGQDHVVIDSNSGLVATMLDKHENGRSEAILFAASKDLLGACKSALRALDDNLEPGPMDEDAKTALRLAIFRAEIGD